MFQYMREKSSKNSYTFLRQNFEFRIVTFLEKAYLDFDGLNLTWETLEGIEEAKEKRQTVGGLQWRKQTCLSK